MPARYYPVDQRVGRRNHPLNRVDWICISLLFYPVISIRGYKSATLSTGRGFHVLANRFLIIPTPWLADETNPGFAYHRGMCAESPSLSLLYKFRLLQMLLSLPSLDTLFGLVLCRRLAGLSHGRGLGKITFARANSLSGTIPDSRDYLL